MQKWLIGAGMITDGQAGDFDGNQRLNGIDLIFMRRKLLEMKSSEKAVLLHGVTKRLLLYFICLNFLDGSFYKRQCSTDCRCKLIMFAQLNLDVSFRKKWQRCDFLFQEFQICFCEIWHKKSAQNHIAVYDRVDIPDSSC